MREEGWGIEGIKVGIKTVEKREMEGSGKVKEEESESMTLLERGGN